MISLAEALATGGCALFLSADRYGKEADNEAFRENLENQVKYANFNGFRFTGAGKGMYLITVNAISRDELMAFGFVEGEFYGNPAILFVDRGRAYRLGLSYENDREGWDGVTLLGDFSPAALPRFWAAIGWPELEVEEVEPFAAHVYRQDRYWRAEKFLKEDMNQSPLGFFYSHVGRDAMAILPAGQKSAALLKEAQRQRLEGALLRLGNEKEEEMALFLTAPPERWEGLYQAARAWARAAGLATFFFVYPTGMAYQVSAQDGSPTAFPVSGDTPCTDKQKRPLGAFSLEAVERFYGILGKENVRFPGIG